MTGGRCRFCGHGLSESFADLGMSPLSNAFVRPERGMATELFYPLHAFVCVSCWLVQVGAFESPGAIFSDYAYFSSYSDSWLAHAKAYVAAVAARFGVGPDSEVIEIASNDGYLLQYFQAYTERILGIEPAANVAAVAVARGVPTDVAFFGRATAERLVGAGRRPDLIVANNVLAHVPDLNDFVAGLKILLSPAGVITAEFPHLQRLMEGAQFDTIYHEHFSYFSLLAVERVVAAHGLMVFDVETLETHGGSLRVYVSHEGAGGEAGGRVKAVRDGEFLAGLGDVAAYRRFAMKVVAAKYALLDFFVEARRAGKSVLGYGAPAKGNTLLNYCGIGPEMMAFTVDRSPHKQGLKLPGTHIPVKAPATLLAARPDYVLILPWNLQEEIMRDMAPVRDWGGRFVVPIPEARILP